MADDRGGEGGHLEPQDGNPPPGSLALEPHGTRPYCKVKLDEYGSRVWKACDGESSVHQLVDAFSETPGPEWQERLARFLHHLRNMGMIPLEGRDGA